MKLKSKILLVVVLTSVMFYAQFAASYVPEQELIFDQVVFNKVAVQKTNIKVGMFIKNYFNYTITNITVSLNFTEANSIAFNSSLFGQLTNGNVTLNSTIQTPSEYEFTPVNITYGFMTKEYLEFNITQLEPGKSMIFYYNVTSESIVETSIPFADMSYYDNWEDLQEIRSQNRILVSFESKDPDIDEDLPQWNLGKPLSTPWAWVIFAIVPAVIAGLSAFLLYFKRR